MSSLLLVLVLQRFVVMVAVEVVDIHDLAGEAVTGGAPTYVVLSDSHYPA